NRGKRHTEHCGKKGAEDQTCHSRFRTKVCRPAYRHFTGSATCSSRISTADERDSGRSGPPVGRTATSMEFDKKNDIILYSVVGGVACRKWRKRGTDVG